MEALLALLVGVLVAAGIFLVQQRNMLRAIFGLIILSNAMNLLFLAAGRVTRASPPLVPEGLEAPVNAVANPLPQALVLTAIVIGFGLLVFSLALLLRGYLTLGSVHLGELSEAAEEEAEAPPTARSEAREAGRSRAPEPGGRQAR